MSFIFALNTINAGIFNMHENSRVVYPSNVLAPTFPMQDFNLKRNDESGLTSS